MFITLESAPGLRRVGHVGVMKCGARGGQIQTPLRPCGAPGLAESSSEINQGYRPIAVRGAADGCRPTSDGLHARKAELERLGRLLSSTPLLSLCRLARRPNCRSSGDPARLADPTARRQPVSLVWPACPLDSGPLETEARSAAGSRVVSMAAVT